MQCNITFVDNPIKLYTPGEDVELLVELQANEVYPVDEIYIKVFGQATCQFLSKKDQKLLHGFVNYLDRKISLLNLEEVQPGSTQFDANFTLPYDAPSSLDCVSGYWKKASGSIKYKVEVHIVSSLKPNLKFENPFTVIYPLDLNDISSVINMPLIYEVFKNFTFDFTPKELYMSASIPQRGFAPGDKIFVTVNVHNLTRTTIKCVRISLNKIMILTSQKPITEVVRIEIVESLEYCGQVKPKTHRIFTKYIQVPALEPNIDNCEVIKIGYELCVKAKASGLHRSVVLRMPVLIGTTRLREEVDMRKYSYSSFETEI